MSFAPVTGGLPARLIYRKDFRVKKRRIPAIVWGWFWIFCSVAVVLTAVSALEWGADVLRYLPETCSPKPCSPHQLLYISLKDIGPAIAGFLVLSAAFGAAATAAWTFAAEAKKVASEKSELREAAKQVVDAEIRSFWGRVAYLRLPTILSDAINWSDPFAKEFKNKQTSDKRKEEIEKKDYKMVRRSMGQDWFVFFRTHPLELSRLPEIQSDYVSLSIVARNLVSRLDYINQADEKKQTFIFWHDEHRRVSNSLSEILVSSNAILDKLNLKRLDEKSEVELQERGHDS
jgi:hypothetical protein